MDSFQYQMMSEALTDPLIELTQEQCEVFSKEMIVLDLLHRSPLSKILFKKIATSFLERGEWTKTFMGLMSSKGW